jgi:glycosyltransferase involved in cell wall biosynthesis
LRIAHVIDTYLPDLLYQEGYLAREQRRRGHDVVIVSRRVVGRAAAETVRIVRGQLPALVLRLAGVFRAERPDVVHVHNLVSQISVAACILKPLFGYRLIVDSHHSPLNTRVRSPARRVGALVFRMSVGRLIRGAADSIFAIAGPERSFTAELLGSQEAEIAVIPLGVDTELFHPDPVDRKAVRVRLGIEDDFVVAHAGRLVPEKRIDTLLDAAQRLGATVLLVGSLDERLRPVIARFRASGGRIVMPGVATKTELASLLRAADVGVWMGFPSLSVIEAMAVGLPVVSRKTPHFRELLGAEYELFAADTDGVTQMLVQLRDQPALAAAIGARNAERGAALAWERIADRIERIYA